MRKLHAWFEQGASYRELWEQLPLYYILIVALNLIGNGVAHVFFPPSEVNEHTERIISAVQQEGALSMYFFGVVYAPIVEEITYRLIPITLIFTLTRVVLPYVLPEFLLVLCCSVLVSAHFGYVHGGPVNILLQGVSGLVFTVMFLKWSGFGRDLVKGLVASMTLHATVNAVAMLHLIIRAFW